MFNSGGGVLHGFSVRILYVFCPRGQVWDPEPDNLARAGAGTLLEQKLGVEKHGFVET